MGRGVELQGKERGVKEVMKEDNVCVCVCVCVWVGVCIPLNNVHMASLMSIM